MSRHLLLVALLCAFVIADGVEAPDAFELKEDSFDKTLSEKKKMMVLFFAPWCGHCKRLAPTYNKLAIEMKDSDTLIAKVDCDANAKLCQKYGVRGYPTLKHISVEKTTDYDGDRSMDSLKGFIKKVALPAFVIVKTVEELDKFTTENKNSVVGLYKDEKDAKLFTTVSEQFKFDQYNFVVLVAADFKAVTEKYNLKDANVFYLGSETIIFEGEFSKYSFSTFLKRNKVLSFGQISQETYRTYNEIGLPLAILGVDPKSAQFEGLSTIMKKLALKFKGIVFCYSAANDRINQHLNLQEPFPTFLISKTSDDSFYAYKGKLEEEEIAKFITEFEGGKMKQSIKSQPIPKNDNPEEIFEIVGDTLEEIINDSTRDVLVKFYASWCGHCKKLEPTYKQLAQHFAKDSKVRIARLNVPENTVPKSYGVQGFPTVIMFRANNKKPERYNGDRSLENFIEFVMKGRENEAKEEKKEEKKPEEKKTEL